jgi:P27 family predicted phage terminase small subunit
MSGPPKKPARLKVIEGNRGKKPIPAEPQFTIGTPIRPAGMPPVARNLWALLVAELDRLQLLSLVDGPALAGACVAYAQARWADRRIHDYQRALAGKKKGPKKGALLGLSIQNAVSKKAWTQFKSFCTEFGLTPASRSRLAVGLTGKEIDLESDALLG